MFSATYIRDLTVCLTYLTLNPEDSILKCKRDKKHIHIQLYNDIFTGVSIGPYHEKMSLTNKHSLFIMLQYSSNIKGM